MNLAGRRRNQEPSLAFPNLFGVPSRMPEGFRYLGGLLSAKEEDGLARELEALPFTPFDFHGYEANRRVVGFGFRYHYSRREMVEAPYVSHICQAASGVGQRPIPHPSLRGALATKQSRATACAAPASPEGRAVGPGLLRFARNDG
jgi:hypothetical protein